MSLKNVPIVNQGPLVDLISAASLKEIALKSLLTSGEKCFKYVLSIWNQVKDSISVELFSHLLKSLCFDAYVCKNEASLDHDKSVSTTILDVWITAPNELKMKYFHSCDYVAKLFLRLKDAIGTEIMDTSWQPRVPRVCYKHNMSFFLQLFSDMPLEMRPKIWRYYWPLLAARSRSETLTCLLSLCLVDQDEIRTFVVIEMFDFVKIKTIVESWLSRNLFYEVIDYSNLCSWDNQIVHDFRTDVFSVIVSSLEKIDRKKLLEVRELIRSQLTINDPEYLQTAMYSNYNNAQYLVMKSEQGWSKVVFWMIERFTPTKRNLRERQIFLSHWYDFLTTKLDDQDYAARWKEFSSWWECEANDCPMFKKFLSVDDIFQKLLLQVVQNLTLCLGPMELNRAEPASSGSIRMEEFKLVDVFLTWYFGTEIAAKNYKRSKLYNFEEFPLLATLLDANNEFFVNDLLKWFFDAEFYEIAFFKDNVIKKTYTNSNSNVLFELV